MLVRTKLNSLYHSSQGNKAERYFGIFGFKLNICKYIYAFIPIITRFVGFTIQLIKKKSVNDNI